jgi:hypothetical protein
MSNTDAPGENVPLDKLPHISYTPLPTSSRDEAREKRALKRMYHHRNLPAWTKKITWVMFPVYGLMRLHDPNYEEHYAQWDEQRRRDYGG